jgi:hypothetical protein
MSKTNSFCSDTEFGVTYYAALLVVTDTGGAKDGLKV